MPRSKTVSVPKKDKKPVSRSNKTSPQTVKKSQSTQPIQKYFLILILFVLAVIATGAYKLNWRIYQDYHGQIVTAQATQLEGNIHFTALKPEPKDKGEIILYRSPHQKNTWEKKAQSVDLAQDAAWTWNDALPGVVYDLQASLVIDGEEIVRSEIVTTTAPSYTTQIPIRVTWKDLPQDVVAATEHTKIGGKVQINGNFSSNTVLEVYALNPKHYSSELHDVSAGTLVDAQLLSRLPVTTDEVAWVWEKAVPLENYIVVAVLKDRGNIVGVSDEFLAVEAGEQKLEMIINSQLQMPAGTSLKPLSSFLASTAGAARSQSLSGRVFLEGPKEKNTSLLMLWRNAGDEDYQVIDRYHDPSHRGTDWQWAGAQAGHRYEVMAALQVDGNNTSTAPNPVSVMAPARNINFKLNTYYVMPHTDGKLVHEVCVDKDAEHSTAILVVPPMTDATQYWLQVGEKPTQAGIYNKKFPSLGANGENMKVRVRVENGKENFMRYSYATCANCLNSNNFAPFSDTVSFTCN